MPAGAADVLDHRGVTVRAEVAGSAEGKPDRESDDRDRRNHNDDVLTTRDD